MKLFYYVSRWFRCYQNVLYIHVYICSTSINFMYHEFFSMWQSDAKWLYRMRSTLAQVIAWLYHAITWTNIDIRFNDNHLRTISQELSQTSIATISSRTNLSKISFKLPGPVSKMHDAVTALPFTEWPQGQWWCYYALIGRLIEALSGLLSLLEGIQCQGITVTSWWAQCGLKSPASRLFPQPFI